MAKRHISLVLIGALLQALALVVLGPVREASGGPGERIKAMSHTHPEGENFSYVCGKIKGKKGKRYKVRVTGPAVVDGSERFTMGDSGERTVSFEIEAAGDYTMKLKRGRKKIDSMTYNVPPPPPGGAAEGPFSCPH